MIFSENRFPLFGIRLWRTMMHGKAHLSVPVIGHRHAHEVFDIVRFHDGLRCRDMSFVAKDRRDVIDKAIGKLVN